PPSRYKHIRVQEKATAGSPRPVRPGNRRGGTAARRSGRPDNRTYQALGGGAVPQWEYCYVRTVNFEWSDSFGRQRQLSRREDIARVCNTLGQEGWELAGVVPTESAADYGLFFKRPKV